MKTLSELMDFVWSSNKAEHFQSVILIEEMSELTKEITKRMRGRDNLREITEEIADVEIVLSSIKFGLRIDPMEIELIKQIKIDRFFEKHC